MNLYNKLKTNNIFYIFIIAILFSIVSINIYILFKTTDTKNFSVLNTKITVSKKIIDLGRQKQNSNTEVTFKILNNGPNALIIKDVVVDCHCTTTHWDKNPIIVNGTTLIKVRYDSSIPGFFQKKIIIYLNSDESPVLLIIRGEIYK